MQDLDAPNPGDFELHRHVITVGWGDCDPARIAYTARIPAWMLEAIEGWYGYCLTSDWYDMNLSRHIGTPFVSLDIDFHSPITPRFPLEVDVYVSAIGHSSLSHQVEGYQDEVHCFSGSTTAVFVDAGRFKPVPIPANMRSNLENYKRNQGRDFPKADE